MDQWRRAPGLQDQLVELPMLPGRRFLLGAAGALATVLMAGAGSGRAQPAPAPTVPSELGSVWWVELITSDLGRAGAFYSSVVGWSTKRVAMADGSRPPAPGEPALLMFQSEGNEVAGALLSDDQAPGKTQPRWIVYFQVDNVDAAIKRTLDKGGTLLIHPFDVGTIVRLAVVADPDGTPFGLATPY